MSKIEVSCAGAAAEAHQLPFLPHLRHLQKLIPATSTLPDVLLHLPSISLFFNIARRTRSCFSSLCRLPLSFILYFVSFFLPQTHLHLWHWTLIPAQSVTKLCSHLDASHLASFLLQHMEVQYFQQSTWKTASRWISLFSRSVYWFLPTRQSIFRLLFYYC